jgi:uncharacterized protein (TIRG00374 family)
MEGGMKYKLSIAISALLLLAIYWRIDFRAVIAVLASARPGWLAAAFATLAPPMVLTAFRLKLLVPGGASVGMAECTRLILSACTLNVVLPSKAGDIAKSWFLVRRGHLAGPPALALVLYEKLCDMLALLLWCLFGLAFLRSTNAVPRGLTVLVAGGLAACLLAIGSPRIAHAALRLAQRIAPASLKPKLAGLESSWTEMHGYFWADKFKLVLLAAVSLAIWFMHLLSVWLFIRSIGEAVPLTDSLALTPLCILAGLAPLTFAGVGTRDAATILLYRDYLSVPAAAAAGVFLSVRYLVLGLAGLPFVGGMLPRRSGDAGGA